MDLERTGYMTLRCVISLVSYYSFLLTACFALVTLDHPHPLLGSEDCGPYYSTLAQVCAVIPICIFYTEGCPSLMLFTLNRSPPKLGIGDSGLYASWTPFERHHLHMRLPPGGESMPADDTKMTRQRAMRCDDSDSGDTTRSQRRWR